MSENGNIIEDIIAEHPTDLLLNLLWDDPLIIKGIRERLQTLSTANLIPYHNQFVGHHNKTRSNITAEHIPVFKGGINTGEYITNMHIV